MSNAAIVETRTTTGGSFDLLGKMIRIFTAVGAASRCAAAFDAGRRPLARDLELLGLEGHSFDNLRR